jgi:hypothetical protein
VTNLRAGLDGNVLYLYHGDVRLPGPIRLADIFSQLYAWLDGHVSEAIVVLIKEDPYPVELPGHLCRARIRALTLSWCFLRSSGCSPVLADQAVAGLSALDPGGHVDRLAGLVQRRSLLPR